MEKEKMKTLKEIWETGKQSYSHSNIQGVGLDDLKKEAIKWIKKLRTFGFPDGEDGRCFIGEGSPYIVCVEGDEYCTDNVENWIFDFFNLTEEDLE